MVPVGIFLEVLSTNKSLVLTKFGQDDNLDLVRSGVLNLDLLPVVYKYRDLNFKIRYSSTLNLCRCRRPFVHEIGCQIGI